MTKKEFSNRIVLISGKELECFPKNVQPDNARELGKNFLEKEREFFKTNAALFYRNAQRILSDSKMFLAPVYITGYMKFIALPFPTLGAVIEWWIDNPNLISKDENGNEIFITETGKFYHAFRLEGSYCTRYYKAKKQFESYSLREVVAILKNGENPQALKIAKDDENLNRSYFELLKKYKELYLQHFVNELEELRVDYLKQKVAAEREISSFATKKMEMKKQLEKGEINEEKYKNAIFSTSERKKELLQFLKELAKNCVDNFVKNDEIEKELVYEFITEEEFVHSQRLNLLNAEA